MRKRTFMSINTILFSTCWSLTKQVNNCLHCRNRHSYAANVTNINRTVNHFQSGDTLQNCTLELATLGDLKLVERPHSVVLAPHDFCNIKANVKVSSTENGIIFGNIGMHISNTTGTAAENFFFCFTVNFSFQFTIHLPQATLSSWIPFTLTSWITFYQQHVPTLSSDRCGKNLNGKIRWNQKIVNISRVAGSNSCTFVGFRQYDHNRSSRIFKTFSEVDEHEMLDTRKSTFRPVWFYGR